MLVDLCKHCQDSIYPDDERVSDDLDHYHIECAERLNIPDETTTENASKPIEIYAYWPDGSRKYLTLDHWPERSDLPAEAVRFDIAVTNHQTSETNHAK